MSAMDNPFSMFFCIKKIDFSITLSFFSGNNTLFRVFLWIFNILGFADLIVAFIDGPRYGILPFLGASYFIIILYVPVLLLTHLMIFKLLLQNKRLQSQ